MKITKVEPILCDGAWGIWIFIKIQTDEGITGYGECSDHAGCTWGVLGCIRDLEGVLLGKDPRPVEKLYSNMYRLARQSTGGVALKAIAGIDTALWDIKAKALGIPLYELFGGPYRDSIRLYWGHCGLYRALVSEKMHIPPVKKMEDVFDLGKEVVSRGYTALKTNIMLTGDPAHFRQAAVSENVEILKSIIGTFRKAVGDKVEIGLDIGDSFNTNGLFRIAEAMEPYNLMWLEVDSNDPVALLQIKQSINIPICSGGILCSSTAYKPFLDVRAMNVAMVEVAGSGFIQSRRIAALADTHELDITPYNANSHLSTFMTAHLCASIPNVKIMGIDVDGAPWRDEIVTELPNIKDGYLKIPQKPGLGVELNEKAIARHPWTGRKNF
jgi:L-alanine-DL-glutamate epimerase-like enolase superfamily enzyme